MFTDGYNEREKQLLSALSIKSVWRTGKRFQHCDNLFAVTNLDIEVDAIVTCCTIKQLQ